jgi:hypothetical protein
MEKQFVPTDRLVVADVVQRYLDASAWLGTARHGTAANVGRDAEAQRNTASILLGNGMPSSEYSSTFGASGTNRSECTISAPILRMQSVIDVSLAPETKQTSHASAGTGAHLRRDCAPTNAQSPEAILRAASTKTTRESTIPQPPFMWKFPGPFLTKPTAIGHSPPPYLW